MLASSSEEPGYSFTSPKSWIPQDWQLPLNWAPLVQMLGHQETEKRFPSGITFVIAFNKAANAILNLCCNREIGFHGITCHVGNLIDNEGMHGLIIMIHGENFGFMSHEGKQQIIPCYEGQIVPA